MSYKKRRNKNKKRLRVVILSTVFLFLFMSAGYAAISTNITLNAKGNIVQIPIEIDGLKDDVVTTGDGLYQDATEPDRYIYKGANPDNYIKFNGDELWRIYSIESDRSIKIIKDERIGDMQFDPGYENELSGVSETNKIIGTRYSLTSGDYCNYNNGTETKYYGCNAWGSRTTTLDISGTSVIKQSRTSGDTSSTFTLPESEAYLNVYLNHQFNNATYKGWNGSTYEAIALSSYYTLDSGSAPYIKTTIWNVGSPGWAAWGNNIFDASDTPINDMVNYEEYYKWSGKVGLLTATEYMRANSNLSEACGTFKKLQQNATICRGTNYLFKLSYRQWLISPYSSSVNPYIILVSRESGYVNGGSESPTRYSFGVRPSVYLCAGLTLKGYGTEDHPYTIHGGCDE